MKRAFAGLMLFGVASGASAQTIEDWGYSGPTGPQYWGRLDRSAVMCDIGRQQSPINLAGAETAEMQELRPRYHVTPLRVDITPRTVTLRVRPGSRLVLGSWEFELKHVAFKMPAEHVIEGVRADMEIQLQHENAEGETAIIAVPVVRGSHTLALDEIAEHLPRSRLGGTVERPDVLLNARDFLPFEGEYYRYMGSLTVPPCREGVNWYVYKTPLTASGAQLKRFRSVTDGLSRPLQQRGNRLLLEATSVR